MYFLVLIRGLLLLLKFFLQNVRFIIIQVTHKLLKLFNLHSFWVKMVDHCVNT